MPELPELGLLFQRFGIALGLGLMIGVEREREVRDAFAGIRTFPLIALLGCTAGLLNDHFFSGSFAITFAIVTAFVLASTIMFARVLVAVFAINPALGPLLLVPIASAGGAGILGCAILWFSQRMKSKHKEEKEHLETKNPFELWSAIQFGLLFGLVLFIAKAAQEWLGAPGVYLSSVVAGGADVDAIVFSLSNLAKGDIPERVAAQAITLAAMSNTAVKGLIAITVGAPSMRRYLVPIFGAMIASGLLVAFLII